MSYPFRQIKNSIDYAETVVVAVIRVVVVAVGYTAVVGIVVPVTATQQILMFHTFYKMYFI